MMKSLKRMLVLLVTIAMMVTMCLPMFVKADEGDKGSSDSPSTTVTPATGTNKDTGKLVVRGIETGDSVKVLAYQFIKANYDGSNGSFSGYEAKYDGFDQTSIEVTEELLTTIMNDLSGLTYNSSNPIELELKTEGSETYYEADSVAIGSYLVVVSGTEAKIYNPVVVSVDYDYEDGKVKDGQLNISNFSETNVISEEAWVKVTTKPDVDKNIIEDDGSKVKGNTANIGDIVNYEVVVDPIPYYGGQYPQFKVVDTLSAGLTYAGELKVTVKKTGTDDVELTSGTDYKVTTPTATSNTLTIDFAEGKTNYTLNEYAGRTLVITYQARLNEKANVNELDNSNSVELSYSKDSKVDGEPGTDTSKTYTYTFDLDGNIKTEKSSKSTTSLNEYDSLRIINKIGEVLEEKEVLVNEETNETEIVKVKSPLAGAEFTLYDEDGNKYVNYTVDEDGNKTNTVLFGGSAESDEDGQIHMYGLEAGTYTLKETKAPSGYSLNTETFIVQIIANCNATTGLLENWSVKIGTTAENLQDIVSFTITHDGGTVVSSREDKVIKNPTKDYYEEGYDINNTKLTNLPSTGGIGTYLFTIIGVVIMVAAAGLFFARRKKA